MEKELNDFIKNISDTISAEEPVAVFSAGRVLSCHDGVILIEGLSNVSYGELIAVENSYALAMNLEQDVIGAILLSDGEVTSGSIAYSTHRIMSVPVGRKLLGRVVNALGEPLDGKEPIKTRDYRNLESPAPGIFMRSKVNRPLYTGIKAIDSMIPIGKGQRELIIGDRDTGKSSIAIDAIINQKGKNVFCVYVCIGQKAATLVRAMQKLTDTGAMKYTVVVAATAASSAPQQYLAPYTGCAIAEYFAYSGKDVLIVYDDLSKHAVAYRAISLLLRRPSGREAYPGDIFYVHSRLLERSAQLSKAAGGGSLTALPIIETQAGDVSSYIPTNVISITDGQIYLESELFRSGICPAINVGLSVSRVGGSAQCEAIRKLSGSLRLDLAHYNEMKAFLRFGMGSEAVTDKSMRRGERIVELMKQKNTSPVSVSDLALQLFVLSEDMFADCPIAQQSETIAAFIRYVDEHGMILDNIESSGKFSDEDKDEVRRIYAEYLEKLR